MIIINSNNQSEDNIKLLFISPCLPYPLDDGIKIRAFYTIKELVKRDYNITLICFANEYDDENLTNLKRELNINIITVKWNDFRFYIFSRIFYTLFSKYPMHIKLWYKKAFEVKLNCLLKKHSYDIIYIFDRSMALYGRNIQKLPIILDSVDSQSLNSLSGYKSSKNIFHKLFWYINYLKSIRLEKKIYDQYKYIITAAERDKNQLIKMTNSVILNIPNGVDLSFFKPMNLKKIPYSLTFLGTMEAFSNQQAVIYFVEKIFPVIKKEFPSVKFNIVGKNPPKEIIKLNDDVNIFVRGYMDDIITCIDKSEIIISPLQMASGIQNKILVSMAMNKPIIATIESIGEIDKVITDKDLIIVHHKNDFISEILHLFSNKMLLKEIGSNGREIIKMNFSWENLGKKIDEIIQLTIK